MHKFRELRSRAQSARPAPQRASQKTTWQSAVFETFATLDLPPPAYVFVSLLHLPNALRIGFQPPLEFARFPPLPAHLTQILSAPVYVEDFGQDPLEMIRPALDPVWNAVGVEHTWTQFQ